MTKKMILAGALTSAFLLGSYVSADSWQANSPDSIEVVEGQISYQLKQGDTLWAVSQKIQVSLETLAQLSQVDLASGEQYHLPVGYIVRWNETKTNLQLENESGKVVNEVAVETTGTAPLLSASSTGLSSIKEEDIASVENKDGLTIVHLKSETPNQTVSTSALPSSKGKPASNGNGSPVSHQPQDKPSEPGSNEPTEPVEPVQPIPSKENGKDAVYLLRRFQESSDMILIESNGKFGLVDVGYRNQATLDHAIEFLKEKGVTELEFIYLTHFDDDHYTFINTQRTDTVAYGNAKHGSKALLDNFKIKEVYLPQPDKKVSYEETTFNQIKATLDSYKIPYSHKGNFEMGDFVFTTYNNIPLTQAEMDYNKGKTYANLNSRGLLVEKDNYDMLLNGDIEAYDEVSEAEDILRDTGTIDILKLGHHGYASSNTNEFLDKLQPKVGVVTNTKSFVSEEEQNRLNQEIPHVYYSGTNDLMVDFTNTEQGVTVGTDKEIYTTITNDSLEGTRLDREKTIVVAESTTDNN